jgi:hypothetical protein
MKKYINVILSIGTVIVLFYTLFDLKNQVKQVDVLKKELNRVTVVKDSLYDETFSKQVELGRYELSLNYLQEVNPKAALQFVNYMNHETE